MAQTEKGSGIVNSAWPGIKSTSTIGAHSTRENGMYKSGGKMHDVFSSQYDGQYGAEQYGFGGQHMASDMGFESRHHFQDLAVHTWQTNGRYLQQVMFYS